MLKKKRKVKVTHCMAQQTDHQEVNVKTQAVFYVCLISGKEDLPIAVKHLDIVFSWAHTILRQ